MQSEIDAIYSQIRALKLQVREIRERMAPEPVEEYRFLSADGEVSLSDLFGDHRDLWIVHNMGRSCSYCTMWADGYSGYLRHLDTRGAFVMVSPDAPDVQRAVAAERDWRFPMVQDSTGDFTRAMGFLTDADGYYPGISAFHRNEDGTIVRSGWTYLGPGDDYNMVWPLMDLLKEGAGEWEPK